jgi:hypothetical protein
VSLKLVTTPPHEEPPPGDSLGGLEPLAAELMEKCVPPTEPPELRMIVGGKTDTYSRAV